MENRRAYLLVRLRNGQVTLEEARELFAAMNQDIRSLQDRLGGPPPPPPDASGATPPPPPPPSSAPSGVTSLTAEDLLLIVGPMAGIFAAMLKKSREQV